MYPTYMLSSSMEKIYKGLITDALYTVLPDLMPAKRKGWTFAAMVPAF